MRFCDHGARPPFGLSAAALLGSVIAALLSLSLWSPLTALAACNDTAPLRHGSQINIAVLVFLADEPNGLFRGNLSDTRAVDLPYANNFVQPHMLGVELYVKQMRKQGALPLPDGQSVTLNFVRRAFHRRTRDGREGDVDRQVRGCAL